MARAYTHSGKFREWDTAFTRAQISSWRQHYSINKDVLICLEHERTKWPYKYIQPRQRDVQYAVYHASDAPQWQLARVSLKGLPTSTKLYFLTRLWQDKLVGLYYPSKRPVNALQRDISLEHSIAVWTYIRINNYIGALRRGGQLDADLKVT